MAYYVIYDLTAMTMTAYCNKYNFHDGIIAELLAGPVPRVYFAGILKTFTGYTSSFNGVPVLFSAQASESWDTATFTSCISKPMLSSVVAV